MQLGTDGNSGDQDGLHLHDDIEDHRDVVYTYDPHEDSWIADIPGKLTLEEEHSMDNTRDEVFNRLKNKIREL